MDQPAISVHGLRKSYGSQLVLDDVSFDVQPGETFAFLGPNGAGKTTTISILLGLLTADAGEVSVNGFDPRSAPIELRRNVGYLAEDQTMYGWMTPTELCRFLKPFYPTWDTSLAGRLLERFDVPPRARIDNLSKGQSVKLGLAVALSHRPAVAILDDPALGLDPIARKQFNRDLVEHLQGSGSTVLYSSHLLHEVEAVADRVAILYRGRIVRQESTDVLWDAVKQVTLSGADFDRDSAPVGLLDLREDGDRVHIVIDGATEFAAALRSRGIPHEVTDLNLDDIFEAYVIGRVSREAMPSAACSVTPQ